MEDFVLVVDDEPAVRELLKSQLEYLGYSTRAIGDTHEALDVATGKEPPTLAILDIEMPGFSGVDLLKRIKPANEDIQIIIVSGRHDLPTVRECLRSGAYDYLAKPFELDDLANTVRRALERRRLVRQNRQYQKNLERMVREQTKEIRETRDMALFTLAKLAESRDSETGLHLERIAAYCRILGEAVRTRCTDCNVDPIWVDDLTTASPLHDIGKVAIPDAILRKPGPLTTDERTLMRGHTTIGGDSLRSVLDRYGSDQPILRMAMEIAYAHHERWDGTGYPRGLARERIPLAARVVALADAYDAITSIRPYQPAMPHEEAVRRIVVDRGSHFDPVIVDCFLACLNRFADIRRQMNDDNELDDDAALSLSAQPAAHSP